MNIFSQSTFWVRYRIFQDEWEGYEVRVWKFWWPFWVECYGSNTHKTIDGVTHPVASVTLITYPPEEPSSKKEDRLCSVCGNYESTHAKMQAAGMLFQHVFKPGTPFGSEPANPHSPIPNPQSP
jgi:hypothetical protein